MYTRFTAQKAEHIMKQGGPMVPVPPSAPGARFLAYVGSAYQEEESVARDSLLSSARLLLQYLVDQRERLSYRYAFTIQMMGRADMKTKGSGMVSGFKIDGQPCSISGGVGQCELRRWSVNEDGTGQANEIIDVRDRKRIATDEWGDIKISRRKVQFELPDRLAECVAFLESIPPQYVTLYSYDTAPTIRQILKEFSEGGGGDDWAIEEIGRKGEKGKSELLTVLDNRRMRTSFNAAVQMLLLCFPGDDTREAVMKCIERHPEKDRDELLMVVAAFGSGPPDSST